MSVIVPEKIACLSLQFFLQTQMWLYKLLDPPYRFTRKWGGIQSIMIAGAAHITLASDPSS